MPMTAPRASSNGPPELPGLIEASVCRALMYELLPPEPSPEATGRFFALMMPVVTVLDRPNGAPIAIVESPTATWSELPRDSGASADGDHAGQRLGRHARDRTGIALEVLRVARRRNRGRAGAVVVGRPVAEGA